MMMMMMMMMMMRRRMKMVMTERNYYSVDLRIFEEIKEGGVSKQ